MSLQKWQERYPEISFALSFFPYRRKKLSKKSKELNAYFSTSFPEGAEIFYIIGLLGYPLPASIWGWLEEKKERVLIFVESNLSAFAEPLEEALYTHPQVHFRYFEESLNEGIELLAKEFPSEKIAVFVNASLSFDSLRLERRSAAYSALYSDVLYSHPIVDNVCANYQRLSSVLQAFDANQWRGAFAGIPAIICGAGPSLDKVIDQLKAASQRALIIAGGSAITALTKAGVRPHFAFALDPNEEEFDRLKQSYLFEGPFLFSARLHKNVFSAMNGPYGYVRSGTGGWIEEHLEEIYFGSNISPIGPDLGDEAFSISTLATSYAYALGCSPLIFVGMDLSYAEGRRYGKGIEGGETPHSEGRALEKELLRKDIYGNEVVTLLKWVMESETISRFASTHKEIALYNATEGGLGFEGVENMPLSAVLDRYQTPQIDLYAKVHTLIATTPLCIPICAEKEFSKAWKELFDSLVRCQTFCQKMSSEKTSEGEKAWVELEFKEETAYTFLLEGIEKSLDHLLPRYIPATHAAEVSKERREAKWKELERQVYRFLPIFAQAHPKEEG